MAMRSLPECLDALLELIMLVCASYFVAGACLKNHRLSQQFRSLLPFSHHRRQTVLVANDQSEINNRKSKMFLAERVGFEPTERFPAHSISSAANSTTLAPLQHCQFPIADCQLVTAGN